MARRPADLLHALSHGPRVWGARIGGRRAFAAASLPASILAKRFAPYIDAKLSPSPTSMMRSYCASSDLTCPHGHTAAIPKRFSESEPESRGLRWLANVTDALSGRRSRMPCARARTPKLGESGSAHNTRTFTGDKTYTPRLFCCGFPCTLGGVVGPMRDVIRSSVPL